MARTRYLDYRAEDSTELLNNMLRGILSSGVYLGYNVGVGGSGSWWLKFTHDTDPDNTGEVLGVLITPDGVHIQENADQDDVCQGSAPGGSDEIHWVVASYTYNKALPNNDVVYYVKTAVAPSTPSLTDDEVLIAEIDVPTGATSYGSAGVDIKTVAKKSLYDINIYNLFSKFANILDPGIYDGMELTEGSTSLDVNLEAGVWITQEAAKIVESSQQADLFTLTNPGNDFYRLAWVVGMHKNEDTDPLPAVDYLLVEGTAVAIGAEASLPSNSTILTAAQAVDAKYTDASYINKLGYIRVENRSGTYVITYNRGQTRLQEETVIVYGANARSPFSRSGKYFGHQGLLEAINDIYAISATETPDSKPYTILLDGDFQMADKWLTLPSHVKLRGYGAPARIESDEVTDGVVRLAGFSAQYDTVNPTVSQSTWGAGSPPSGYVARTFVIQPTYRVGEDLVAKMFSKGDPITVFDTGTFHTYDAVFQEYDTSSNNWTINVYIADQYNTDGNPLTLYIFIQKKNIHLENLDIGRKTATGDGLLYLSYVQQCGIDKVRVRDLSYRYCSTMHFGEVEVYNDVQSWVGNTENKYDHLKLNCPQTSLSIGDSAEYEADIGILEIDAQDTVITADITFYDRSHIGKIILNGGANSVLNLDVVNSYIGSAINKASGGDLELQGAFTVVGHCVVANDLRITASGGNTAVVLASLGGAYSATGGPTNKVLHIESGSDTDLEGFGEHANSDRNLRIVSEADITWNSGTGVLSWNDALRFDNPWRSGYSEVAAGSATLGTDGDRLYADINRGATGVAAVGTSVRAKANASNDAFYKDRVFVAIRYSNDIYLFDGTRIEDGQTVKLGSTPPPDGSVTYPKLADSALKFHNRVFRDYVCPVDNIGLDNTMTFFNATGVTFTYAPTTGIIQFASSVDLSQVLEGDRIILRETDYEPLSAGQRGRTWEEIILVENLLNRVTIAKGLDITVGASNRWNGSIFRGNKVMPNMDAGGSPVSFSFNSGTGRVTYSSPMGFNNYMVRAGFVFVDSAGQRYVIQAVDPAGSYVDVDIRDRDLDASTPTSIEQGSIEMNNNPYELALADLRVLGGMEFIPIDGFGPLDTRNDVLSRRVGGVYEILGSPYYPRPYDSRVRLSGLSSVAIAREEEMIDDASFGINRLFYNDVGIRSVEVTAVCTGAIIVLAGGPASAGTVRVDGYSDPSYNLSLQTENFDNMYGMVVNRYEPQLNPSVSGERSFVPATAMRLNLGIHHFIWGIPAGSVVRGIILLYGPQLGNTNKVISDIPGRAIKRGGEFVQEALVRASQIPTNSATWDKGGRLVRYLDLDTNYQFATQWVRSFTGTGDLANGSTDVQNVSNITAWKTGDLVMFIVSGVKYLHRIDSLPGANTIRLATAYAGPSTPGATIYYYGQSAQSDKRRNFEEIAQRFNMLEFAMPGNVSENRGTAFFPALPKIDHMGVRLNDLSTYIKCSAGLSQEPGGAILLGVPGNTIYLGFIGTGLSIELGFSFGAQCRITVDEGYDDTQVDATYLNQDAGGAFVCGELPYGFHNVKIVQDVDETYVYGFTVWQPKKPATTDNPADALDLLDTNVVGASEAQMGIDETDGVNYATFGTIQQDWGSQCNHYSANSILRDVDSSFANSIMGREHAWFGGVTTSSDEKFLICFYGDEITLITDSISVNAGSIAVYFLDHDGQLKVPSALTGFTATGGPDGWTADSIINGERHRYVLSEMAFHIVALSPTSSFGIQNIDMDAIEIHTPFHVHKSKLPVSNDHFLPWPFAGNDVRNQTPFKADYLPGVIEPHAQGIRLQSDPAGREVVTQFPFIFYTRGGFVEIGVSGSTDTTATSLVQWNIMIDGMANLGSFNSEQASVVGEIVFWSCSRVVLLKPGFHFALAYVVEGILPSSNIFAVGWRMREIAPVASSLPSRGFGPDTHGPLNHHESSF